MKMDAITYRYCYSNADFNCLPGFEPYKSPAGLLVYRRDVICQPIEWHSISAIAFSIIDCVAKEGEYPIAPIELESRTYDAKSNIAQQELIRNLCSQQLRGRVAENTAASLFHQLFLFSDCMPKHLPDVVAGWLRNCEQFSTVKGCGISTLDA